MDKGKHVSANRRKPDGGPIVVSTNTTRRLGRIVTAGGAS